jgi:hypothetical protein
MFLSHARMPSFDVRKSMMLIKRGRRLKKKKQPIPVRPHPLTIDGAIDFKKNPDIIQTGLTGGETVLFHMKTRTSLVLNETAARVFSATNGTNDVRKISKIVEKMYNIDVHVVFEDVKRIYMNFFDRGIVIHGG